MNLVDIHCHVLFKIDDGAKDIEESITMLRKMVNAGVSHVVATPHLDLSNQSIEEYVKIRESRYKELNSRIQLEKLNVEVLLGCELMFTSMLGDLNLSPLTINNTDYILIELSTRFDDPTLELTLRKILDKGLIPVLAHTERYSYLINDSSRLVKMIKEGVLIQVNIASFKDTKYYPFIKTMLNKNLIHLVGSDMHNMHNRSYTLNQYSVSVSFNANAKALIDNELVEVKQPKKILKLLNKYF